MKRLDYEDVKEVFEKCGYILLSDKYENAHQKLDYICKKHPNKIQSVVFYSIRKNNSCCKYCGIENIKEKQKYSYETVLEIFKKKGYTLLSQEYINNKQKLEFLCTNPNHGIQKIDLANLSQGKGCKLCGIEKAKEKQKLPYESVKQKFEDRDYILLDETYIDSSKHLKYICKKHPNTIQKITYANLYNGCGCPLCKESKGEKKIREFFMLNNIKFKCQKTFKDCIDNARLRFDFYLTDYNILIEYQGIQHYVLSDFGGKGVKYAQEEFNKLQIRDNIKREYCKSNNIKLLEIPYWDFKNINTILYQELKIKENNDI